MARSVRGFRAGGVSALRREFGVNEGQHLLVLAAKFTEIADALPGLFVAIDGMADVHLVIKTHPAETPAPYLALWPQDTHVCRSRPRMRIARLLAAADVIVTRNSTVAIDSLVLGVPALVIGAPSNLAPFVDAGVMVASGADITGTLERLPDAFEWHARPCCAGPRSSPRAMTCALTGTRRNARRGRRGDDAVVAPDPRATVNRVMPAIVVDEV